MTTTEKERVPLEALTLNVGTFEFNSDDDGESQVHHISLLARSKEPINHWYWGRIVHDNDGVMHKDSIALDYDHDTSEIIGFADSIGSENGDLMVRGQLTPFNDDDRASEILFKSKKGVPYEASINFAGDVELEEVRDGESATVNGYEFNGPGVIVRKWHLRGLAVCPYGADSNTQSNFSNSNQVEVNVTTKKSKPEELAQDVEPVVAEEITSDTEPATELSNETPVPTFDPRAECKKFVDAFGNKGGVWFAEGLSFDEASQKCIEELRAENSKLKQEKKHIVDSEPAGLSANDDENSENGKRSGFASRITVPSRN